MIMKKRFLSLSLAFAMSVGLLAGCGSSNNSGSAASGSGAGSATTQKQASWKVTCPWAPSGVAAMVSQKAASKSPEYSDTITLVAEAVKGDAATVNTWVMDTEANDPELVFVGEGLLSITSIIDPAKMKFTAEDFTYVENLYSSIFVLSAAAELNIKSIADLEAYVAGGNEISVAVNGATSSEAFLAAALFGKMGVGDKLKLTPYQSAAEAAQAVAKGETQFAVSHQSQILETYQQGGVTIPCAFDEKALEHGPFAGVEGVGEKGYPYFRNRCFVMARAGTDEATVAQLKDLYDQILADEEVTTWLQDTMLLEVDTMSQEDVDAHVENVKNIVNEYKDIVAG
jgi:tripartite-type tricarboxylate transporter receptor subunit TctC